MSVDVVVPKLDRLVAGFPSDADFVQDGRRPDRARVQAIDEVSHRCISSRKSRPIPYSSRRAEGTARAETDSYKLDPESAVAAVIVLEFPRTVEAGSAVFLGGSQPPAADRWVGLWVDPPIPSRML